MKYRYLAILFLIIFTASVVASVKDDSKSINTASGKIPYGIFHSSENYGSYTNQHALVIRNQTSQQNVSRYIIKYKENSIIETARNLNPKLKKNEKAASLKNQRNLIRSNHNKLSSALKKLGNDYRVERQFTNVFAGAAVTARSQKELEKLPYVEKVFPDTKVKADMLDTIPLLNAEKAWSLNSQMSNCLGNNCITGKNVTIAIIDTGIDPWHEDLGGNGSLPKNGKVLTKPNMTVPSRYYLGGIDGHNIVYSQLLMIGVQYMTNDMLISAFLYDDLTNKTYKLSDKAPNVDISGNIVAEMTAMDGYGAMLNIYDLSTDSDGDGVPNYMDGDKPNPDPAEIPVTIVNYSFSARGPTPKIYGKKITWIGITPYDSKAVPQIFLYDLSIDSDNDSVPNYKDSDKPYPDPALVKITNFSSDVKLNNLDFYSDYIVWDDLSTGTSIIQLYNLSSDSDNDDIPNYLDADRKFPDSAQRILINSSTSQNYWPSIHGDKIAYNRYNYTFLYKDPYNNLSVYNQSRQVRVFDILTSEEVFIDQEVSTQLSSAGNNPIVFDNTVSWTALKNGSIDVYYRNLNNGTVNKITCNNNNEKGYIHLDGDYVSWGEINGYTYDMSLHLLNRERDFNYCNVPAVFPSSKVLGGYNFVTNNPYPFDDHGHGTHVASIAAGKGPDKNHNGVYCEYSSSEYCGIAPDANIYAFKVLDNQGEGSVSKVMAAIEGSMDLDNDGYIYGIDSEEINPKDKVDIISMSLGANCGGKYNANCGPDDPISLAVDNAVSKGVVVVVSAGNDGPQIHTIGSPGTARNAITVGATYKSPFQFISYPYCKDRNTTTDNLSCFSSRGPVISLNGIIIKPDILAPGVSICAAQWDTAFGIDDSYANQMRPDMHSCDSDHVAISGTSMSTPIVAGAVALIKQKNSSFSPQEIKSILKITAIDLGYNSTIQGSGRINILAALKYGEPNHGPNLRPLNNITVFNSTQIIIQPNASDPDGDSLTYGTNAYETINGTFTFDATTGLFNWTPVPFESDKYILVFNVSDGLLSDTQNLTIVVSIIPNCTNIIYHPEINLDQPTLQDRINFCLNAGFWKSLNMEIMRYAGLIFEKGQFNWYGNCRDTSSSYWNSYPVYEIDLTKCNLSMSISDCYDSDGGINYSTKGRTGKSVTGPWYDSDYCQLDGDFNNPSMQYSAKNCSGQSCMLIENSCYLGYSKHDAYYCEKGCYDGACI